MALFPMIIEQLELPAEAPTPHETKVHEFVVIIGEETPAPVSPTGPVGPLTPEVPEDPEEQEQDNEEDLILDIDPEELEEEEEEEEEEEDSEATAKDRPQHLQEPVLNESRIGKAHLDGSVQQKTRDADMETLRTHFKRFLPN